MTSYGLSEVVMHIGGAHIMMSHKTAPWRTPCGVRRVIEKRLQLYKTKYVWNNFIWALTPRRIWAYTTLSIRLFCIFFSFNNANYSPTCSSGCSCHLVTQVRLMPSYSLVPVLMLPPLGCHTRDRGRRPK